MKNNRPQTSKIQKSSSSMTATGQGARGQPPSSQGQRLQRQISASGSTTAPAVARGAGQGVSGRLGSSSAAASANGSRSQFQRLKALKLNSVPAEGHQAGQAPGPPGGQQNQDKDLARNDAGSTAARGERTDPNSWFGSFMGTARVADLSEEIETMISKPPGRSISDSQAGNTNFLALGLGQSSIVSPQHDRSAAAEQAAPYQTCWCHFSAIQELTTSLQTSLKAASGDQEGTESTLDMRCIYNKGSTSLKVITAGGQEFVVPMELPVEKVWAIEDGVIIQALAHDDEGAQMTRRSPGDAPLPSDIHMGVLQPGANETPSFKQHGGRFPGATALNRESPPSFTYLTLTHHPLDDLHPLQLISSSLSPNTLMVSTADNLLFTSPAFPLVIMHNQEQSQLKFALLKSLPSRHSSHKGHIAPEDYAQSLQPSSRHPVLSLSPKQPALQLEVIWHITSTQAPTSLQVTNDPLAQATPLSDLIIQIFYREEKQLAFIKFSLAQMRVSPAFVLKDVLHVARCHGGQLGAAAQFSDGMAERQPWQRYLDGLRKKVAGFAGAIGVVDTNKTDEVQIYRGTVRVASFKMTGRVKSMAEVGDGSLEVVTTILGEPGRSKEQRRLVRFDPLSLGAVSSACYLTNSVLKILRTTMPSELYQVMHQDLIEQQQQTRQSNFAILSTLLLSWIRHEEVRAELSGSYQMKRYSMEERHVKAPVARDGQRKGSKVRIRTEVVYGHGLSNVGALGRRQDSRGAHRPLAPEQVANDKGPSAFQALLANARQDHGTISTLFSSQVTNKLSLQDQPAMNASRQPASDPEVIITKTNPQALQPYIGQLFTLLHYLHEDLLLSQFYRQQAADLGRFLCKWIMSLPNREALAKVAYTWYYINLHKIENLSEELKEFFGPQLQDLKSSPTAISIQQVPVLQHTLSLIAADKQSQQLFLVLFESSKKVLRAAQTLALANGGTAQNVAFASITGHTHDSLPAILSIQSLFLPSLEPLQLEYMYEDQHIDDVLVDVPADVSQSAQQFYLQTAPYQSLPASDKLLMVLHEEDLEEEVVAAPGGGAYPAWAFQAVREGLQGFWEESARKMKAFKMQEAASGRRFNSLAYLKGGAMGGAGAAIKGLENRQGMESEEVIGAGKSRKEELGSELEMKKDLGKGGADELEREAAIQVKMKIEKFLTRDSRMKEATNFLSSEQRMALKMTKIPNFQALPEEEQKDRKQKALEKAFVRQLSKMVGRGLLQFGTKDTISTERLMFRKISQQGTCGAEEAPVTLEVKEDDELVQWPLFHNGAAEAIKILLSLQTQRAKQIHFARNWIMQHKPASPKADHAGFLLALGLFGLLDSLVRTDIYQHLKSMHDSTVIATLLGKSASQKGEMDQQFTKTLCVHISYLQPPSVSADISLPVQSAAMIGAALQYLGSQNRPITEMLLTQIGRKPINDRSVEREVYALSAGMALGFVNLGAGPRLSQVFGDLNIEERLIRFIEGGKIMDIPKSMLQANQNAESHQCSSIREGDQINIHITSAGGLFALTLIYLQTGNFAVCHRLQMPETFNQLEYVRPPFLLQKTLSRNLIMWDGIEATKAWVDKQIPEIIKFAFDNPMQAVEKRYQQQISGERCDFACIALCHAYISTGACLSIGYKYAGTCDPVAFNLIDSYIKTLRRARTATQQSPDLLHQIYTDQTKNLIDKHTQENCLCMLSLALALIMAGSGDIEAFRTLRAVRKRLENEMHYGHNLAINMAIGLLFLGSGAYSTEMPRDGQRVRRATLGPFDMSDKFTVASLMCSLFPIFPKDPSDNRYHLQALRHFWLMVIRNPLQVAQEEKGAEETEKIQATAATKQTESKENQQQEAQDKSQEILYNLPARTVEHIKALSARSTTFGAVHSALELPQAVANIHQRQTTLGTGQEPPATKAIAGPQEKTDAKTATANNTLQHLFLDTRHTTQKEEHLKEIVGAILGGSLDGLEASDHVTQLLKDSYMPSEVKTKLSMLSAHPYNHSTSTHFHLTSKQQQIAHIQAIKTFNAIPSPTAPSRPPFSPFAIQILHLLVAEFLSTCMGSPAEDKMLQQFKCCLFRQTAQLTVEEVAQIGQPAEELEAAGSGAAQANIEILKSLQAVVDCTFDEHGFGERGLQEEPDRVAWNLYVQRVLLPGLLAI